VQTSRIVALALIGIMLSSSSLSVANGYTIKLDISKINIINDQNYDQQFYKINLNDGVSASYNQKKFSGQPQPYKIKLFDGASIINEYGKQVDHSYKKQSASKTISINISDGVGTDTTDYNNDNSKIIHIKNTDERKALWERIFPLDRIRNGVKSFYQIIQNDHSMSYIQMNEIDSKSYDYSLKQTPIDESALVKMSEFEKFVEKSWYVADQIEMYTGKLLDPNKFVGKAGYVADQLAIRAQDFSTNFSNSDIFTNADSSIGVCFRE